MNQNICIALMFVGCAILGGVYEYPLFAPVHGAEVQQNDINIQLKHENQNVAGNSSALEGTIDIGILVPLTGDLSRHGEERKLSAELAIEDFNAYLADSGSSWSLSGIVEDSQTNPVVALEKVKSMHDRGVKTVVGPASSSTLRNLAGYATANDMILVSYSSTAPSLAIPDDNIFRTAPDDNNQGHVIASLIASKGIHVLVPMWREDAWGNGVHEATAWPFVYSGGIVDGGIIYDPEAPNFSAAISLLADKVQGYVDEYGADKVGVLIISFAEVTQFMQQASSYDILDDVMWFGTDGSTNEQSLVDNPIALEFAKATNFTTVQFAAGDTPARERVSDKIISELGRLPNVYAYGAYDAVWLAGLAMEAAGSTDTAAVKANMIPVAENHVGAVGSTKLNTAGDLHTTSYVAWTIRDDQWHIIPNLHNSIDVTSQGVHVMGSDEVNHNGYTGKGIKMAVIDLGFDIYNSEIAENIAGYESFWTNSGIAGQDSSDTSHGTAAAEIIVDIAPDVELYLYNVDTSIELLNLVDHIIDRGDIDIVSVSLAWANNVGPIDGTSDISQKVNQARDAGILWINSAGNYAEGHWEGKFSDPDGNGRHNFYLKDETIGISVDDTQSLELILSWDDWDLRSQDYDLCIGKIVHGQFELIYCSEEYQNGLLPPVEVIEYDASEATDIHVSILKHSADRDVNFQLFSPTHDFNEYTVPSSSLFIPADADGALSVGASHWANDILETYSSQGPTIDGRIKPDISGPTGVITTAYCNLDSCEGFGGTSAAAPHVAGAAALVMEKYPDATDDQVQTILETIVHGLHPKSNLDGTGRVDVSMLANSDILALHNSDPNCSICFFPETLRIEPGDTITWTNAGNAALQISWSSDTESFQSPSLERGETYSVTFDNMGTFTYHDVAHPWATGQITVVGHAGIVRGTVFSDSNGNGVQDAGEAGIVTDVSSNVAGDTRTITTSVDGNYAFSYTEPGNPTITVTVPYGYAPSQGYSDVYSTTVEIYKTKTVNFPLKPTTGTVSGTIFSDDDSDGMQGADELGIQTQITILTTPSMQTMSDELGSYTFEQVPAGIYDISITTPAGYAPISAVTVTVIPEETVTIDIAAHTSATPNSEIITGTVFSDLDGNGIHSTDEPGIEGYEMIAIDRGNTADIATTLTDADGVYSFDVTHHIADTQIQTGFFPLNHTVVDPASSWFAYINPGPGNTEQFDVGFYPVPPEEHVTLNITVYHDRNANGTMDPGERGIGGLGSDGLTFYVYTYTVGPVAYPITASDGTATIPDLVPADFALLVDVESLAEQGYIWTSTSYERDDHTSQQYIPTYPVADDPEPASTHVMELGLVRAH